MATPPTNFHLSHSSHRLLIMLELIACANRQPLQLHLTLLIFIFALSSATRKYVRILHIELIQLHEIQHNLRSLPYLDVFGRLRLTLRLARCTLALPCAIDAVLIKEAEEREEREKGGHQSNGSNVAPSTSSTSPSPTHSQVSSSCSEPSTSSSRRRRRRNSAEEGGNVEGVGEDEGEGEGAPPDRQRRRKTRRPRVRTAGTSGPFDDAPYPPTTSSSSSDRSSTSTTPRKGGLLHPRVNSMLLSVCGVLEYGERVL